MVEHVAASSPLLTVAHRRQFAEEGWCVVDGIYSEAEIAAIDAFFEDYRRIGTAVFDSGMHYEEIDPTRRQLRAMHPHRYSEQAKGWALNPRVIDVLAGLLGRAPLLAQLIYHFPPRGSWGLGIHPQIY
jgi:hypothetical protein